MSGIQPGRGESPQRVVLSSGTAGTAVIQSKTVVNLGAGLSDSHDYTAVLTTFRVSGVLASASGLVRAELFVNAVSKFVGFNSTANPNIDINITEDLDATVGQTVSLVITNREADPQNIYSTISGEQLPSP